MHSPVAAGSIGTNVSLQTQSIQTQTHTQFIKQQQFKFTADRFDPSSGSGSQIRSSLNSSAQILSTNATTYQNNGPLLTNVEVIPIFWGSSWQNNPIVGQIQAFLDWILTSPLIDMLSESYSVPGQTIGYGTRIPGNYIIPNAPSTIDDWIENPKPTRIGDFIKTWITANLVPSVANPQQLYLIFVEQGVTIHDPTNAASFCAGGSWGGYHFCNSTSIPGTNLYYGVVQACSDYVTGYPNLSEIDILTFIASHEVCESITDPLVTITTQGAVQATGWAPEIGDICEDTLQIPPFSVLGDNDIPYLIQKIWSNDQGTCTVFPRHGLSYSVLDAPAMTTFGDRTLQSLMVAWCEAPPQPPFGLTLHRLGTILIMNNAIRVNGGPYWSQPIRLQDSSNPNPETTIDTPALSPGQGGSTIYIAWTAGNDPQRHLNLMSTRDFYNWGSKQVLNESSYSGPALAYAPPLPGHLQGVLFLAWTGTDGRINIRRSYDGHTWNDSDKIVLQQYAIASPGIAYFYPNLYLFWRGTQNDQIWISASSDLGNSFYTQVMIPNIATDYTPGLTLDGSDLILAWRDSGGNHNINTLRASLNSPNPLNSFGNQEIYGETASGRVSLAPFNGNAYLAPFVGRAYVGWAGTDLAQSLNIMQVI